MQGGKGDQTDQIGAEFQTFSPTGFIVGRVEKVGQDGENERGGQEIDDWQFSADNPVVDDKKQSDEEQEHAVGQFSVETEGGKKAGQEYILVGAVPQRFE